MTHLTKKLAAQILVTYVEAALSIPAEFGE